METKTVKPAYLKQGDRVAIISPAYWVPQTVLNLASETIKGWGLEPVIGHHVNYQSASAYAGTAEERAADLLWALQDDSIKAIFCSRGGYGSMHLLNRINKALFHEHPKWLIGHGDITTLLYAIASDGVTGIYGPMAFQMAGGQEQASAITRDILFGTLPQYVIPVNKYNYNGRAEGILVGGNMSCYSAMMGTRFLPPERDLILFFDEVEEPLHNIDRMFYKLRLLPDYERIKGVILGSFNHVKFDLQFDSVEQMLTEHLADYDIPVCCGFPVGSNSCIPLMVGAPCTLEVSEEKSVLTFNLDGERKPYTLEKEGEQLFV